MPGSMTPEQNRCAKLGFRCFTGFDRADKEKRKPILEEKALEEWKELLEKRFPQPVSGGRAFVLKIAKVVKDKKTQEGLDLTGKDAILEHLAKWCERMCKEHSIGPGSEAGHMHVIKQSSDAKDQRLVKVRGGALGRHGASERAREIASID